MSEGLDTVIGGGVIDEGKANACFKQGCDHLAASDRMAAIASMTEAVELGGNPEHMHQLAYQLDLMGEEDAALEMYEQATRTGTPKINTLVNLGVLYELSLIHISEPTRPY